MQLEERDYFTDHSILKEPYEYLAAIYSKGPIYQLKDKDIIFVTGYDEAAEILRNSEAFSSVVMAVGVGMPLPFVPEGDDITAQIDQCRDEILGANMLVALDGAKHAAMRSLLASLFVPSRLKANEEYMVRLADKMVKDVVAKGQCDLLNEIAIPYATLVIADSLGVPENDRDEFMKLLTTVPPAGDVDSPELPPEANALFLLAEPFANYIQDRRDNPRNDILTELASAKLPDGATPEVEEVVGLATLLFAAGQDTSAKLLGNCLRFIAESSELQQKLRTDRALIPAFIEEVLRLEGSIKVTFRLARKTIKIGDKVIVAGQKLVIALAAANRDPRRWEDPKAFKLNRERVKEHMSFGRGAHTCIGAPLARAEVRIMIERLLEHTSDIGLSEQMHGAPGNRKFDYYASFIVRGFTKLNLELKSK